MEFLKDILGEELFNQFVEKVNSHNGNEDNKDKQIKIANLASGEYVGKGKHDALAEMLKGKETELESANGLIAELKKASKGNEEFQNKITTYEGQIEQLQKENAEIRLKSAIKVALMQEKAVDVDYLTWSLEKKMQEKGEALELDANDNIKGWKEHLEGLKVQHPTMFEAGQKKVIEPNVLKTSTEPDNGLTQEQFNKMGYQSRLKLKQEQPEVYAKMTGKE